MNRFSRRVKKTALGWLLLGTTGAVLFQFGTCTNLALTLNPCGTIFGPDVCTPQDYDLLFSDSIPNFNLDPTCIVPFYPGCTADTPIFPTPGPRP